MIARANLNHDRPSKPNSQKAGGGHARPSGTSGGSLFYMECQVCGYEPEDPISMPRHECPKCHSWSWKRMVRPGIWLGRLPDWPGLKLRGKARQRRLTGEVLGRGEYLAH